MQSMQYADLKLYLFVANSRVESLVVYSLCTQLQEYTLLLTKILEIIFVSMWKDPVCNWNFLWFMILKSD